METANIGSAGYCHTGCSCYRGTRSNSIFNSRAIDPAAFFWWHRKNLQLHAGTWQGNCCESWFSLLCLLARLKNKQAGIIPTHVLQP